MSSRTVAAVVILASLACASFSLCARNSIEPLLNRAEEERSSNPVQFARDLSQLNAGLVTSTPSQQQQIAYLNAYSQIFSGHLEAGIRQAKQILASATDVNLKFRAGALLVNGYILLGDYNEGLRQLEHTLALSGSILDPALRQHGAADAAQLYDQIGQYQLALRYADQIIAAPATPRWLCMGSYIKFDALQHQAALPLDDGPLERAIDQCAAQHELAIANLMRITLARNWVARGQGDRALGLLRKDKMEVEAARYPRLIAENASLIAELLYAKGDLEGAKREAKTAAALAYAAANTAPIVSAYRTLYQVAEKHHDLAGALAYYKLYADADKGYLNEAKARELSYQIVRSENQQKNQQIELLNRQNSLLQLQQQVDQKAAQNSRLMMLLAVLGALTIAYWGYKTRRLQASLRRMAQTDALTGICNRHHFTVKSARTLAQCARGAEHVALIMFDLDHFKSINDSYGHATGDWVLKRVAETCAEMCRKIDHLGRLGGEEFAILLHGCDLKAATRVAEDCRVHMSRIDTSASGYMFPITASFGVSATSMSGYDLDKLMSHADQMLYRAKREGRNRVRAYAPDRPIQMREHAATEHAAPEHAARRGEADFPDAPSLDTASA